MKKIKSGVLLITVLLAANITMAQTLEEGRAFMYYEKYISAKNVFQKLVSANPNNVEAVYWLGQSQIAPPEDKDIAGAKSLYQKTLESNSNSALLIAGMGHIALLEGNGADGRNRFETAITQFGIKIAVCKSYCIEHSNIFSSAKADGSFKAVTAICPIAFQ